MKNRMKRGQAMLEYVVAFASLLVVVGILFSLVDVAKKYAQRTENLVRSEYP
jgi:uncharacterized protein (UPF0333 family)